MEKSQNAILNLKSARGQSVVEYILLLGVVMTIVFAIFKSGVFDRYIGGQSVFFSRMRSYIKYTYRHARSPDVLEDIGATEYPDTSDNNYGACHESYCWTASDTRFFIPSEEYR